MEIIPLSSLEKVFSDEAPQNGGFVGFSLLKNERASFQIAFKSESSDSFGFSVSSDLNCNVFLVECIPSVKAAPEDADDYFLRKESGMYPDLLRPVEKSFTAEKGKWHSLWIELDPNGSAKAGEHRVEVEISDGGEKKSAAIAALVIDALLPEQKLIYTNWFHSDCLATHYGVQVFSEEYWRITENFVRTAVRHGQNMILTPLFTPPLDTAVGGERLTVQLVDVVKAEESYSFGFDKLRRWVNMCLGCGVKYFEMSHMFTQWGAKRTPKVIAEVDGVKKQIFGWKTWAASKKYTGFLRQLAAALNQFIADENIKERCFFHVSDEPGMADYIAYKRRSALVHELFPDYRVIDALSDYNFYKRGVIKTPIPSNSSITPFIGNVPELWTYYCCGQYRNHVSNRFFAMPSQRNRVLGMQLYKFNVVGFLQWGYNFWFSQYSKYEIDPFKVSDAGNAFPSGDAYVVYPGDNGEALVSLRLKVFYDGLEDMRALQLLETLAGREVTIKLLEEGLNEPLGFTSYPTSAEWQLKTRERINAAIAERV